MGKKVDMKLPRRSAIAMQAGRIAARASQLMGRGSGGMIGGAIAEKISPKILAQLAAQKKTVVVSGTNGKSTTTAMVRAALNTIGQTASNDKGDNMGSGVLSALMNQPDAPYAVCEVDELHVPLVSAKIRPAAFVLLNLSRDQLDRVGEIGHVEKRLRAAVDDNPQATVIANCDDPLIVSAAMDSPRVIWVSVGSRWYNDSVSFPRGGKPIVRQGEDWYVKDSPYRRPDPDWMVREGVLINCADESQRYSLDLAVPGQANQGNAAQAIVAAHALGVPMADAVEAVRAVQTVAGRYATYCVNGRQIRMLLAKNPAGWQEAITMINTEIPNLIIDVNGQIADSTDLSWLWDVDFDELARTYSRVIACGDRGLDLAIRLQYAGIDVTYVPGIMQALEACPSQAKVELLANYTAFRDAKKIFDRVGTVSGAMTEEE
ncbi:MurT ligase domain-containing protein [Trueperella sp. LYQ141]|uniref:MurT ligase domain-containing protein n=1 Tax=Trueperella sp. LYQ141 TaxID=3391058 RepID=UPI00398343BE